MKRLLLLLWLMTASVYGQYGGPLSITGGTEPVDPDDSHLTGTTQVDSLATKVKVHGILPDNSQTLDLSDGGVHTLILGANRTVALSNMTGTGYYHPMLVMVVQDATGGWTFNITGVVSMPQVNTVPNSVTWMTVKTTDNQVTVYAGSDFATGILPQSKSANYTLVIGDANTEILHPASDNNARVFTIPANSSVAFPIGTNVTFTNMAATSCTIAITTDTATLIGAGSTGTRTLAQYGQCCYHKISATAWTAVGTNLTYWLSPELEWLLAA